MSDATTDYSARLNLADLVARIERTNAETHKFVAEQAKLTAEQSKLAAEAAKLNRDRAFAPWQIAAGFMGAGAALFGAGVAFWKVLGGMSPTRLRECLDTLGWSQRGLADMLGLHETRVRRWARGAGDIPTEVAEWLERLTAVHAAHPLPDGWERQAA